MRALDATISASFEDSGMGGVNNSKKNKSAGKCIVRAWNRIYSRFLRFLSGSVSEPGEIPSIQRRLAAPQVLETPQSEHSYRHGRSRSSNYLAISGPKPDSPSHSLLSSPPSTDSLGSLGSSNSLVYVSTPKSVDWVHSQRRVLDSKERKANATRCKAHSLI